MHTILISFPALTISILYCFWRSHYLVRLRRQQQLCERVAHMLWVLSQLPDANEPGGGRCGPDQPTPLYPHRPLMPPPKGPGR